MTTVVSHYLPPAVITLTHFDLCMSCSHSFFIAILCEILRADRRLLQSQIRNEFTGNRTPESAALGELRLITSLKLNESFLFMCAADSRAWHDAV